MNSVLHQQLEYARSSELEVKLNFGLPTVAMTCEGADLCFMQGEEAEEFIDCVEALWEEEDFNGTYEEAELICGYPYLDLA
jgi:hypothetical protein